MRILLQSFDRPDPGESEIYAFDFAKQLGVGEAIESTVWSIAVIEGVDASASSRLDGMAQVEGAKSCQRLTHLVAGASYRLLASVTTTAGNTLNLWTVVTVNDPG